MKIKVKQSKLDAILTADWHLMERQPVCRTDDFWTAQWNKVQEIAKLQIKYDCPVLHAGDLFEHWKPSPYLLSKTIESLPKQFLTVLGNHDLPQHNLELMSKSGVYTLQQAGALSILPGYHWGQEDSFGTSESLIIKNRSMRTEHVMTWKGKCAFPGDESQSASKLLKLQPNHDLILTGHNHQTFTEQYNGRLLVNPGSLTRHKADQTEHKPCVFLYYADTNTVTPHYLQCKQDVISRVHIEQDQVRNNRIDAFITRLDDEIGLELDYEKNVELYMNKNKVEQKIQNIVNKAIEL